MMSFEPAGGRGKASLPSYHELSIWYFTAPEGTTISKSLFSLVAS
jgi:hypothetical protein